MSTSPERGPHDLLAGYLLDALDPDESARFRAHLADCARCRAELADLGGAVNALADSTRVAPPADLEDRIMARLDGPVADAPVAPANSILVPPARRRWLAIAAAAAAVLAVGVVGVAALTSVLDRRDDPAVVAVEAQQILDVAGAPDAHFMPLDLDTGAAKIVVSDQMNMAAVMATDLPMPSVGEEYHVWTVMTDGTMMPAASFAPDAHGSASVMLDTGVRDAAAFMLTIDTAGATHPTGATLAEVRL